MTNAMLTTAAKYTLKIVSDAVAFRIVCAVAGRTRRPPVSPVEQKAMSKAVKRRYGESDQNVAWEWGKGPVVVLVHGWGGRGAQMAPLASQIADQGYRCIALDVTGHGDSPENHTRWDYFIRDTVALSRSLGEEVYAYVGHSAGGMTMMAARSLQQIRAERFVCICAPSFPFPPIHAVRRRLDPRETVLQRFKDDIATQFGIPWERLETANYYADAGPNLLLAYDERDRFVPHTEGDKIHALCAGSSLVKTRDYSHQRILTAPELFRAVSEFLRRLGGAETPAASGASSDAP
jgi:pimeloyl-ACP methyl ester carboxylesterase